MKNKICNESIIAINCSKFTVRHKTIIRFGITVILSKNLLQQQAAATKNLKTIYTFFVKPTWF